MTNAIQLNNLSLSYKDRKILKHITQDMKYNSITGIVGLSGAGKTTLIRLINGNIKNDANVKIDGEVVLRKDSANKTSTVYQDPDTQIVFPDVLDEITFGMENYCFTKEKMQKNLDRYTKDLGIESLLKRNPNNLSGGEKQLVVLCSILCIEPKILLLDECISQVDDEGRSRVKSVLLDLKQKGACIVMVEHNHDNLDIADEIFELKDMQLKLMDKGANV